MLSGRDNQSLHELAADKERVVESTGWLKLSVDSPSMRRSLGQRLTGIGIYRGPTSATLSYLATTTGAGGCFLPLSYTMTATTALEEALNYAISCGRFIDTKITLFSRRDSTGTICKPKALYANSHVLESVPYFKDCEFSLRSSAARDNPSSQYYLEHLPRQRLGTFPRPTTTSSRKTTAILRIVTSKRISISRTPTLSRLGLRSVLAPFLV